MEGTIHYHSTNLKSDPVTFKQALLKGLAPDKGLYMPEMIPSMSPDEIQELSRLEYHEIALRVTYKFLENQIPKEELARIVKDAYNFPVPLEKIYSRHYVMRLDQGPTASFKDFAARMMGRLMQYYLNQDKKDLIILTATSGDTGSAIANAFYGLDNIKVMVLFPQDEVTPRQRKQMTTLGKNIEIIAIDGKFDDCQALVKTAFSDGDLNQLPLSSANSINIGRLLPQSVYYFWAYAKLNNGQPDDKIVFSVPSGNFGDLMGGLLAQQMGLPVKQFVVATNANDEVPKFMQSGEYHKIEPSRNCISSAMNVGHPSNFARIIALYGGNMDEKGNISKAPNLDKMKEDLYAISISDAMTKQTIADAYQTHSLLLEPHGAVGWGALQQYIKQKNISPDQLCVSLETAHPAKFPEQIQETLSQDPALPPSLDGIENKPEQYQLLKNDYEEFKQVLKKRYF